MGVVVSNFASSTEDRASGAQVIDGSLRFDSSKSHYLRRTPSNVGNRKTFTISFWSKGPNTNTSRIFQTGESLGAGNYFGMSYQSGKLFLEDAGGFQLYTDAVYRDPSAWYHIVVAVDTTLSSNRIKRYVNGVRVTAFSTEGYPGQNTDTSYNNTVLHYIGAEVYSGPRRHLDNYITNWYSIDGQALGPENFGYTDPLTNTWRPKKAEIPGPNDGTIWSAGASDAGWEDYNGKAAIFDGSLTTRGGDSSTHDSTYDTLLSGVSVNVGSTIRLYWNGVGAGQRYIRINGSQEIAGGSGGLIPGWESYSFTGTINTLEVKSANTGSYAMSAVEIDGVILIDGDTENFGINGFYLPMDGNSPIGEDKSGNGNNWTPVNFGGSMELPKATGAIPILNTNDAGTVAKGGVRADKKTYIVTASGGNYYLDGALKPTLNVLRGGSYTFDYTGATSHPFYLSSLPDGKHNSKAYSVHLDGTGDEFTVTASGDLDFGADDDWTMECFFWTTTVGSGWAISDYVGNASATGSPGGQIYFSSSTGLHWYQNSAKYAEIPKDSIKANRWHHLAFVKDGTSNTIKSYLDGVQQASTSFNGSSGSTSNGLIIGQQGGGTHFNGYISNFRVVKGQQVYTDNFTPSTTPLTSTSQGVTGSNCKLLAFTTNNLTTPEVGPSMTASGDPIAVNSHSPFLYNDVHGNFGLNTGTSNTTKITIPHHAADTLYYYCSAHSGMGSSINVTTDIFRADPYAWKNVLALPLVGSNTDESANINVNSSAKTLAVAGNTSPRGNSNHYGSSYYFDGTGDYLGATSNADFAMGTGDFTLECWVYRDSASAFTNFIATRGAPGTSAGYTFGAQSNANGNDIEFYTDGLQLNGGTQFITNEKWHHVAVTRSGTNLSCFVNGILSQTVTNSQNFSNTSLAIGITNDASQGPLTGYLQDIRVYKGVAKYSASVVGEQAFIVPSINPDVLPDTPSGVSGGSKLTKVIDGAVSFDGADGTALQLSNHSDIQLGSGTNWTIEFFAYRTGAFVDYDVIAGKGAGGTYEWFIEGFADGSVDILYSADGSTTWTGQHEIMSNMALNRWYHIALVRNGSGANNFKAYVDGIQTLQTTAFEIYAGTGVLHIGGYNGAAAQDPPIIISNFRIVNGSSVYTSNFTPPSAPLTNVTNTKLLCAQSNTSATAAAVVPPNEPFSGAGGAQGGGTTSDYLKVSSSGHSDFSVDGDFTFEWWHYRAAANVNNGFMWTIGDSNTATGLELYWGTSGSALKLYTNGGPNSVTGTAATGWHHYAVVRSGNTIKVYYDGTEGGSFTNTNTFSGDVRIGAEYYNGSVTGGMNGPMSQFRFVKGTAVYTSNFTAPTTALTAITNTKLLTLQGSTITDASGTNKTIEVFGTVTTDVISKNGNVAATNFNPFTTDINAVRGQETGYATLNPLDKGTSSTLSDGNLKFSGVSLAHRGVRSSIRPTIKVYAEMVVYNNETGFGFATGTTGLDSSTLVSGKGAIYNNQLRSNGSSIASITTLAVGDLIQVAYDPDSNKAWIGRNNLWYDSSGGYTGNPATGANATFTISEDIFIYTHSYNAYDTTTNFGQKPFKFPPPDGFQPLNAANVRPSTVVARPDQYVGVTTYSGSSGNVVVDDLNFKPDAVWIKQRNASGFTDDHVLVDSVRGRSKSLYPSGNYSENTSDADKDLISFDINGFTLGPTQQSAVNRGSSGNYVAWTWKAGGNSNTFNIDDVGYASFAASGITAGTVTPTGISAGTKQGFSIIKYDGAGTSTSDTPSTIPHGLLQSPSFFIVKAISGDNAADDWFCYHQSLGASKRIRLNQSSGADTQSNLWGNGTSPTSSVISINKGWYSANYTGHTHILYAWHDVPGLQKFGKYSGNNVSDGPYIELGFRPALIIIKNATSGSTNWRIIDSERGKYNVGSPGSTTEGGPWLYPNLANQEVNQRPVDLLSNGFKIRYGGGGDINYSTDTFIYAAWAEAPAFNLYGGQSNAR